MADILCPACGKLNPGGSDVCQFCQADLVAPTSSPDPAGEQEQKTDEEIFQEPVLSQEVEKDQHAEGLPVSDEEPETPDWLRRIRIRHATEQPAGEPSLGVPDIRELEPEDELRKGNEDFEEGQKISSGDFIDWSDPGRQASDTVPILPTESLDYDRSTQREFSGDGGETSSDEFPRFQPPPAFTYNLRITSTQHAHADLLDSVVSSEGVAAPIAQHRELAASPLLRWAIAAILFVSILWPIVTGRQGSPMPFLAEETGQVNNLIEQLPEDASVLLAFDFEPGYFGELDAASAAVVDHLVSRGAYLTLVSTLPAGPVLAERYLTETINRHKLVRNTHYVNLGFIPGGPTGLIGLAENLPRALPYTLDGEAAWSVEGEPAGRSEFPPLEGIEQLSDFNLVLILVDDPFTARTWIEQVQPRLAEESIHTPIAMVVSAQVEPLVRPYYDANPRQVQGFVTGLRGGTAYQQMTGRDVIPGSSWEAFIYGMSVAGLLLLTAGLAGIALTLFDQRRKDQNGGIE